jgi:maleate isomerase
MYGSRGRIGVLVPPGNPTVEPEMYRMTPAGVSIHFARFDPGDDMREPGGAEGLDERTRAMLTGLAAPARAIAAVKPAVVVLAHTGVSYVNGFANEQALIDRLASLAGATAVTAARSIRLALEHLGVKKLALGTPYPEAMSALGKAYWQAAGFKVVGYRRLEGVSKIYPQSEERAYQLAREADVADAEAVLVSGTGLPTVGMLDRLEQDLGKPAITSMQASFWQALRLAGFRQPVTGFGRLLREL